MTPHFRKLSYKRLLQVTVGTRWWTSTEQRKPTPPTKTWGSGEHVLLLMYYNVLTSSNSKKDFPQRAQKWAASERYIRLTYFMTLSGSSGPFLWCHIFAVSLLPVVQSLFCLASTMGELGPAICAGIFKDGFCFTFCYSEVNANCFYVV